MNKRFILVMSIAAGVLVSTGYFARSCYARNGLDRSDTIVSLAALSNKKNIVDVLVVGSGPAGWSAALYAARAGMHTVVITGPDTGGQLMRTSWIENLPGIRKVRGAQAMKEAERQAVSFGAHVVTDVVQKITFSAWPYQVITADGRELYAQTVIIATGATPRKLQVPGEQEFWGTGVTSCAICDAPFFSDKNVVVVGGGDSAAEEALQLVPYVKEVTILVRKDHMRASAIMQERIKAVPSIHVLYNSEIMEIMGDEQVRAVQLRNTKTGVSTVMPIDGVFLAIGHIPNTTWCKDSIACDEQGYIETIGRSQKTSILGVFAAGDVQDSVYRQAGVAQGDGIKAALDAISFLNTIGFNKVVAGRISHFQALADQAKPLTDITSRESSNQLIAQGVVLLDFYTKTCPACDAAYTMLQAVAGHFADRASFYKVDIEAVSEVAHQFHVTRVPCIILFKNGKLIARYTTPPTQGVLLALIDQLLESEEEKSNQEGAE